MPLILLDRVFLDPALGSIQDRLVGLRARREVTFSQVAQHWLDARKTFAAFDYGGRLVGGRPDHNARWLARGVAFSDLRQIVPDPPGCSFEISRTGSFLELSKPPQYTIEGGTTAEFIGQQSQELVFGIRFDRNLDAVPEVGKLVFRRRLRCRAPMRQEAFEIPGVSPGDEDPKSQNPGQGRRCLLCEAVDQPEILQRLAEIVRSFFEIGRAS